MKKLKIIICIISLVIISLFSFVNQYFFPKIVILATYHKPAFLLKSDVVLPIQGGRDIEPKKSKDGFLSNKDIKWLHTNMIGDNTGENISKKNRRYSELSSIYWLYKNYHKSNIPPQYIGLVHYRRQLLLNSPSPSWEYKNPYYVVPKPTTTHLNDIGLTKENISKILKDYDIIVHRTQIAKKVKNMEYTYRPKHPFNKDEVLNYNMVMKIVLKHYPEMADDVATFGEENKEVLANMFIMPYKEFIQYAQFLFCILDEIDKGIDYSNSKINPRILGIWGEQLTSFYIYHLENKGLKIKESKAVFIGDSSLYAELPEK